MAKKRVHPPASPPRLVMPRDAAQEKVKKQIERGREIDNQLINSEGDLERAEESKSKWRSYVIELLTRLFDNDAIAKEFGYSDAVVTFRDPTYSQEIESFKESLNRGINKLESIFERLELIPEVEGINTAQVDVKANISASNEIFVVHGHDEAAKLSVARLLEKLHLQPIILHEQPNAGRTIIEKFEHHSVVGFAVAILTPDDIGFKHGYANEGKPRARQNVIFELGYFLGKLGRSRVCALYKEGVEIPSDYSGVLFILMDSGGVWKFQLAKEIRQAGIEVDLNNVI